MQRPSGWCLIIIQSALGFSFQGSGLGHVFQILLIFLQTVGQYINYINTATFPQNKNKKDGVFWQDTQIAEALKGGDKGTKVSLKFHLVGAKPWVKNCNK